VTIPLPPLTATLITTYAGGDLEGGGQESIMALVARLPVGTGHLHGCTPGSTVLAEKHLKLGRTLPLMDLVQA
jgi:hypothetical protein